MVWALINASTDEMYMYFCIHTAIYMYMCICVYVTVPGKTDHFVIISDSEILVPRCSAHFALHNGTVRLTI